MKRVAAMRLYLIRHPRPDIVEGICYGSSDVPVRSPLEESETRRLAEKLPNHAPVYSSPLSRCAGLAKSLSAALGSPEPIFDARLTELDFGRWEMQGWDRIPRDEIDAWAGDVSAYRPGGGESVLDAARRIGGFYAEMGRAAHRDAVVVCHAGTIRLLQACAQHQRVEGGITDIESIARAAGRPHLIGYGELVVLDC